MTMYQSTGESNSFRPLRLQCSNVHANINYDQLNLSRHYQRQHQSRYQYDHAAHILYVSKFIGAIAQCVRKFRATENHSRCRVYPKSIPEVSRNTKRRFECEVAHTTRIDRGNRSGTESAPTADRSGYPAGEKYIFVAA